MSKPLSYPSTPPDIIRRSRVRRRVLLWDEARVIVPILLVAGSILLLLIQSNRAKHRLASQAKAAMTAANAPAGPAQRLLAAGDDGAVVNFADGSWVVIRQERSADSDATMTVALDSGGQWYVTDKLRHGQFMGG